MAMSLTAIIPCKNEADNIEDCVASLRHIADEILVADSGSTDGTMNIARALGCRIIEREYVHSGDFKNWAIPQAKHEWVLLVDADERVTSELAAEITQLLGHGAKRDGYWLGRHNYFMGRIVRYGVWSNDRVLRLFRRDLARYVGDTDHAEVAISSGQVGTLNAPLRHNTYTSYSQLFRKLDRYTEYQAMVWKSQGRKPHLYQMLLRAPLRFVQSYVVRLGFLDGVAGLQVAMIIAFYSFLKQVRLWEMTCNDSALHLSRDVDGDASIAGIS
jgi:glycosyltransferase involved in cell wall biosynthesis